MDECVDYKVNNNVFCYEALVNYISPLSNNKLFLLNLCVVFFFLVLLLGNKKHIFAEQPDNIISGHCNTLFYHYNVIIMITLYIITLHFIAPECDVKLVYRDVKSIF